MAEIYRSRLTNLYEALDREESRTEAAEIIRSLVDEIVLTPEDGELKIALRGDLAGILAIATNGKRPTPAGNGLSEKLASKTQVQLVAGGATSVISVYLLLGSLPYPNAHRLKFGTCNHRQFSMCVEAGSEVRIAKTHVLLRSVPGFAPFLILNRQPVKNAHSSILPDICPGPGSMLKHIRATLADRRLTPAADLKECRQNNARCSW